jgi:beta-glucanase (GH16 family)
MRIHPQILLAVVVLFILLACSENGTGNNESGGEPGYVLVWEDDFSTAGAPDADKWSYDTGGDGWGNQELQYYTDRTVNANVQNGFLYLEARKEAYQGRDYTSARLVTRGKGDWKYGRIEVRAKLPQGRGTWPAIWMLPTDWVYGGWPNSGEIDIMEHVGYDMGTIHGTVHTEAYNHMQGTQKGGNTSRGDVANNFYTYSITWTADSIDFYVDDEKFFTFTRESSNYAVWPFDQEFHLILNIAVGGNWGGAQGVDDAIFPQAMVVDYIRVYEWQE